MRTILGWFATLMLCSTVLVAAAQAQPTPPCVDVDGCVRADEWYTYRYNDARTGVQPYASPLSDPRVVGQRGRLKVKWSYPRTERGVGEFRASPIVVGDTVFIGSTDGYFYAIDAATGPDPVTGKPKWQFPKVSDSPLLGSCGSFGHYGIFSSATFAVIGGQRAIIFGAPDPDAEGGLGSARLFALTLSGGLIWKSDDVVAHVSGCTPGNPTELHERIAYSPPLALGNRVYVGVHDADDNPIQKGRVVAVDLNTGHIDRQFNFVATGMPGDGTRGGGIWNALATDGTGVYFTTGNTRCWNGPDNLLICQAEPNPNHGLSMIRIDKSTGTIIWKFQPVPFALDDDPDWAAGATVMSTSCGELIASVQKDGWSYAVDPASGNCHWQFPPVDRSMADPNFPRCTVTGYSKFARNDPMRRHGSLAYLKPGAAWNDVLIIPTGGESRVEDDGQAGYGKLHALNACAGDEQHRVRWIADIIPNSQNNGLGAPTVTGGIVFVGTDQGHLIVLADPSIEGPNTAHLARCSNTHYTFLNCPPPYVLVPGLTPLADVAMPDGGDIAGLRKEAALAKGRVFVATLKGHVYMLDTVEPSGQCLRCCGDNARGCLAECEPGRLGATCRDRCSTQREGCVDKCNLSIECVPAGARP